MKVLVTGASGFVGRELCRTLVARGFEVAGAVRTGTGVLPPQVTAVTVGALGWDTPWRHALSGVHTVFHLAARVHIMKDRSTDPLEEFRRVNVAGTLRLAQEAARAGVRRLVFVSSVKVLGEESPTPYRSDSVPQPRDPYGVSKWEAELALAAAARRSGLEVVVLRPPLVYGSGVRANFLALLRALERGIPLPLGAVRNQRSIIYLGNLVDALAVCAEHPAAAGQTYLVSDGEDLSTPALLRRLACALDRRPILLPIPPAVLRVAGGVAGSKNMVERLVGSLAVDSLKIRSELGWLPPYSVDEGLQATAAWYLRRKEAGGP